jgi:cytidine deaminase
MTAADLHGLAREAAARAHAPYSGLRVGAVVEDEHGRRHPGVNVESASYGLTICAERAALARAVGEGARRVARIAVAREDDLPISPCGACRQALADFGLDAVVVYRGAGGLVEARLADLLPDAFALPS